MEDYQVRFNASVAARLSAAPQSADKEELIEELSDNLYHRFLDMTNAGMDEETAFQRAMEDLGDVDELLAYLGVCPPDVAIELFPDGGLSQVKTKDGTTVCFNTKDAPEDPAAICVDDRASEEAERAAAEEAERARAEAEAKRATAEAKRAAAEAARAAAEVKRAEAEAAYAAAEAAQAEAEAAQEEAETLQGEAETAQADADHESIWDDLGVICSNVSEVCHLAAGQAKEAIRQAAKMSKNQAKSAVKWVKKEAQRYAAEASDSAQDSQVRTVVDEQGDIHINCYDEPETPETPEPPESPEAPETPEPPKAPKGPNGWEFAAEVDTDAGRFFAGASPKQEKDIIYGFGYDKAKGGFFTQWGEWKSDIRDDSPRGPHFTGKGAFMEHRDDDSYSVTSLRDLRGIEVHTVAGDVDIHISEAPDAGVIIDGDVDDLDVTCSADGVLTIREGRTASSSFFSRRGIGSADVELYLPRRLWESISVCTTSGDIVIDQDGLEVNRLLIQTTSGDLSCELKSCAHLCFKSSSGDLELEGNCALLQVESMSGDVRADGIIDCAELRSASGDILVDGSVGCISAVTRSGDVEVETKLMPGAMELASKSGACRARIPDAGPFTLEIKTVSGDLSFDFPLNGSRGRYAYGDGSGPAYSITSVSGDVTLERY